MRRLDDHAVADGHLHVAGMWEHEVSRLDLRAGHRDPVVDLVENPPQPNDALRELMRGKAG